MFDLEKAIEEWRDEAAKYVPSEDLEELEAHLRDGIDERQESGFTEEEAFAVIARRLGDTKSLGKELISESGKLPPRIRKKRRWFGPKLSVLVPMAVAVLACFLVECFREVLTSKFTSRVVFEPHPLRLGMDVPIFDEVPMKESSTEVDLATEVEFLYSKETLYMVVDDLDLDELWELSRLDAYKKLWVQMRVKPSEEGRYLRVDLEASESQQAFDLANGVLAAYRKRKMSLWRSHYDSDLASLRRHLKDQSDKAEEARLRMLDLAERYRISPQSEALAGEVERKSLLDRREAEMQILKSKTRNIPMEELRALELQLELVNSHYQGKLDNAIAMQRRAAEWGDAKREYELHRRLLEEMQETYVKTNVLLAMPLSLLTVHEAPEVATREDRVFWSSIWLRTFANGWIFILLAGVLGWWLCSSMRRTATRKVESEPRKKDSEDEISWA